MSLTKLELKNVLSFGPDGAELELKSLNVLIGPNGSGKSNLIEAITLLRAAPRELTVPVREGGGVRDWLWKDRGASAVAEITATLDYPSGSMPLRHSISFAEVSQRFQVTDERVENVRPLPGREKPYFYFGREGTRFMLNVATAGPRYLRAEEIDSQKSILAQRRDPAQYPEITYLAETYEGIRVYREWAFGRYTPPRLPQKADLPNDYLMEDASNLALALNKLRKTSDTKERLLDALRQLYDGIRDFDVAIEGGTVQLFLQEGRRTIPATRLSDGTLRFLSLLCILCDPTPHTLICIEEPELGLHPDVLPSLAKLLREASERTQIIVTTHSDTLVDCLTDDPDVVVVTEKKEGSTGFHRLESEKLQEWLKKYTLGTLWTRGDIGGTRW
jgi:predicted ATPase